MWDTERGLRKSADKYLVCMMGSKKTKPTDLGFVFLLFPDTTAGTLRFRWRDKDVTGVRCACSYLDYTGVFPQRAPQIHADQGFPFS